MKVVAFNCSPMANKGNTALILDPFLDGIRSAGAKIELFYTNKLKVNPCQGELNCLFKTPGKCFQNDDMQMLLTKLREADIWVFATPVHIDGITSPMKKLMERMLPLVEALVEVRDGHCRYRLREGIQKGKIVLVSTCGNWEMDNFNPLIVHMKAASKNIGKEFENPLLRPHAAIVKPMIAAGIPLDDIFEAARESGRQLIEEGTMQNEMLNMISRELMPRDMYIETYNQDVRKTLEN